jgi:hypothetical protein
LEHWVLQDLKKSSEKKIQNSSMNGGINDAVVIGVSAGTTASALGTVNWHDPSASSLSEMLVSKTEDGEWLYIQSNLDQNIFLLKKLDDMGLLPDSGKICDCGIGLGTAIFDIYLQSKKLEKNYSFVGIEKQSKYLNYLNENLLDYWNNDLQIVEGDLMDQKYDDYNIIYCYTPFRDIEKLRTFYLKVIEEMQPGSILIENKNYGLGEKEILTSLSDKISEIELDGITVFKKL